LAYEINLKQWETDGKFAITQWDAYKTGGVFGPVFEMATNFLQVSTIIKRTKMTLKGYYLLTAIPLFLMGCEKLIFEEDLNSLDPK